jgi:hypothetical protein
MSAIITRTLAPGAYYVEVRGNGGYGVVGQYNLTITTTAAPAAPGAPDLAAASDTGVSDTDNLTRLDNLSPARRLTFTVPNTTAGAAVLLYANGAQIGVATATGTTTTVVTSGDLHQSLLDGVNAITARVFETSKPPSAPSAPSAPLTITVDTQAPLIRSVEHRLPPPPGFAAGAHELIYTFDESVQQSLAAADLTVETVYGPRRTVAVQSFFYNPGVHLARFTLAPLPGENSYRATLSADGITDAAGNAVGNQQLRVFYFHVLQGDVNRDGSVNGSDFSILAANFGKSGMGYGQGDLTQNGRVDGSDFAVLAGNFGRTTQSAATAGAAQAAAGAVQVAPAAPVSVSTQKRVAPPPRRKLAVRRASLAPAGYHPAP